MDAASNAALALPDDNDIYVESDFLTFNRYNERKRSPEIRIDIDIGSNSVKLAIHQESDDGLIDMTKDIIGELSTDGVCSGVKASALCGLGRDVKPNDAENASLNDEAIAKVTDEVLPGFMKVITHLKVKGEKIRLGIVATAAVRNSLKNPAPEGHEKTVAFLRDVERITGATVTVASEKLEVDLSVDAVLLLGATESARERRSNQGIMYYGGGNSIQVAKLENDAVVGDYTGVLQIGSRSLADKKHVDGEINKAVVNDAPWLNTPAAEATDAIFSGGMFRLPGRGLALLMEGVNPATEHMPIEGYSFKIKSKEDLQAIRDNLLILQEMTPGELFKHAVGATKAELCERIKLAEEQVKELENLRTAVTSMDSDLAHAVLKKLDSSVEDFEEKIDKVVKKKDVVQVNDQEMTIAQAKKLLTRWESKIEKRFPDLPNDAQFVLNRLTRMYGKNGEKMKAGETYYVTFSGGNTRLAMAANLG